MADVGKKQLKPCPHCGKPLEKVRQSRNSMLNAEQFDAARLGDYFCDACPETGEQYRYFWDSDLTQSTQPKLSAQIAVKTEQPSSSLDDQDRGDDAWIHDPDMGAR